MRQIPVRQSAMDFNDALACLEIPSFQNISMKLRVRRPTSPASSQASAEDSPLFMASKAVRKHQRSLSAISNRAPKKKGRHSETCPKTRDDVPTRENMARDRINREISEWHNVYQTSHPSWWSPVCKWAQGGVNISWQEELPDIPLWHMNLDSNGHRSRQRYDQQRRAVTDSYLIDNSDVQDLAHLIAVQLLGACFTLPPEHMSSCMSSTCHCFNTLNSREIPHSRLISSLRMHTEARYSPLFGHQACDTSPVYRWQGAYDGPSRGRSRELSSGNQSVDIQISKESSRKRRIHRALHVTEGSMDDCSMHSHAEFYDLGDVLPTAATTTWHRLRHGRGTNQNVESPRMLGRNIKSCPSTPGEFDAQLLHSSRLSTEIFLGDTTDALQSYGNSRIPNQPSSQILQSLIRSEPYHISIQPVRQLVVKRWRTLRHRFGYGLGYVYHDRVSRRASAISVSASSRSTPTEENGGSPTLSSDGKERRRQARERGDIHSNSTESTPRYNTPASTGESGMASPGDLEHPSPELTDTQTLAVTEAIANAFADSGLTTAVSLCFTPTNSQTSSAFPSPSAATTSSLNSGNDLGYFVSPSMSNSKPLQPPPTFSTRRHGQRRHQRSNLSEVCTPEDIEDRSVTNPLGSPLKSPREESGSEAAGELGSQIPKPEESKGELPIGHFLPDTAGSSISKGQTLEVEPPSGNLQRPRMVRTSTSGTQVFTPSEDGVELDGLPTGPPSETWDDRGHGMKRKERSFL